MDVPDNLPPSNTKALTEKAEFMESFHRSLVLGKHQEKSNELILFNCTDNEEAFLNAFTLSTT